MFFPRSQPLELAPAQVRGLRISLNTPVVATEDLPIGPARAAILIHEQPGAGETVTIGIRSLRGERFAVYAIDPELGGETTFDVAVDAALSFAESMGFLFDEDELGAGGAPARARCLGLWRELLGDGAPARPGPEGDELLLEDLAEEATEVAILEAPAGEEEADANLEIAEFLPAPAETRPPKVSLSKFRSPLEQPAPAPARPSAAAAPAAARSGRGTALGRLRLVRRVRDGVRKSKRNPILRLFGAF